MKKQKKRLVLKIGTSTLTLGKKRISYGRIEHIGEQLATLKEDYDIILVSSGAIAMARQFVNIDKNEHDGSKQALAAIGQARLIRMYDEIFNSLHLSVAQCLLTYQDFNNENGRINTKNTINKLLEVGFIPIINENDTVSTEEIILGDNDKLSALVASISNADLLVLASDIDGLFTKNPFLHSDAVLIPEVTDLDDAMKSAEERESALGTGGMTTKILAAQICKQSSVEMWVVNGGRPNFLIDALNGIIPFTKFKV